MKKYTLLTTLFLLCALLTACGKKQDTSGPPYLGIAPGTDDLTAITDRTEYYDITVESEELFDLGLWEKNRPNSTPELSARMDGKGYLLLGTQFFMGEPVQLWAVLSRTGSDIYLYSKDGTAELLLQNISLSFTVSGDLGYHWYMDGDKNLYCYRSITYIKQSGADKSENILIRFLPTGEALYTKSLGDTVFMKALCQAGDGRMYLLFRDTSEDKRFLAEIAPDTGELLTDSRTEIPYEFNVCLGASADAPVVTGDEPMVTGTRVMKVNPEAKSLMPVMYFNGTSYGWHSTYLCDLQVLEDGHVELLWTDYYGNDCIWESLRMEKVEKTPIVVRGIHEDAWLADRIALFNQENKTFHVILEVCGNGNDGEDFSRLTNVQIGSGKGPDILLADLGLDFTEMTEKGILEDLAPYMEASGIREEDYFPYVFASWRQGEHIYSVNYNMDILATQIDEKVLGSRNTPDIETLADALLTREGNGLYRSGYDSGAVLESFLQGTESLWGMVDWEKGSCDFNTPLFGKLLEAARRYGDDGRKKHESTIAKELTLESFFQFDGQAAQTEKKTVTCGVLFDDGCHGAVTSRYTMALNANSPNKEGAWEFISYLIGADCQEKEFLPYIAPIRRDVYDKWLQAMIERWGIRYYEHGVQALSAYCGSDISKKKQSEYTRAIEDARPLPTRTVPVLTIILEEAEGYFGGYKSAEEVSRTVNNRVQLYLDEMR